MNEQGPNRQHSTLRYHTVDGSYPGRKFFNGFVSQDALSMRSWQDPQRPIVHDAMIEMNAKRYNLPESTCRSVRIDDSFFY